MYQEYFAGSDLLGFPLVALGIFFVVFVAVVGRVVWGIRRRERLDHLANLPLEPDSPPRPAGLAGRES